MQLSPVHPIPALHPTHGAPRPIGAPEGDADVSALVAGAGAGDERAWSALVDAYARRIYALAKSRCRNDAMAEEITQSVFVTIAAKLGSGRYAERGAFESWLFRIAMNRIRDEMRRVKRQASPTDPQTLSDVRLSHDPPPHEPDANLSALREAMQSLSGADREVVELRHHGGLSFHQIASILGEPMGTVLARHHRALKKLRTLIEDNASPREAG